MQRKKMPSLLPFTTAWLLSTALLMPVSALALTAIEDEDLGGVTGEGVAITLENIALRMGPTSYMELTGTNVDAGAALEFRRGDLRWYGISYTGAAASPGQAWSGSCTAGIMNMGCPMGGTIEHLAPHDNPLILRSFDYVGVDMTGNTTTNTVFETLYPSNHERYRYAFWGEINVGTGSTSSGAAAATSAGSSIGTGTDKLQVQNIWNNIYQGGTLTRLFQTTEATDSQRTLGIQLVNHFEADIRMSVAQTLFSPDTLGQTPEFDSVEGLYIGDYRIHLVNGQLHYQAMELNDVPEKNGDFQIALTPIPNIPNVYNKFYGRTLAIDPTGGYDRTKSVGADYEASHGYVRMGDFAPQHKANNSTAVPYSPPGMNARNAPVRAMATENASVSGCMSDRPGCSAGGAGGINSRYDTSDGIFFVAAPGQTFKVFERSPNYMWDANLSDSLNDNEIYASSAIPTATPGTIGHDATGIARLDVTRINLGDVNIQGMVMNSLTIRSLGAQ